MEQSNMKHMKSLQNIFSDGVDMKTINNYIIFFLLIMFSGCTPYHNYIFLSCECENYKFSHSNLEISVKGIYSIGAKNSLYSAIDIKIKNFGKDKLNLNIENIYIRSENYNHKLVNSSIMEAGNCVDAVLEFYADYNKRTLSLFPDTKQEIFTEIVSLNLGGIFLNNELVEIEKIRMRAETDK